MTYDIVVLVNLPNDEEVSWVLHDRTLNSVMVDVGIEHPDWTSLVLTITKGSAD